MRLPQEPTPEQVALVVAQAHWLTERYESNSEGFLNRAGIFLGLLGVEAAIIAAAPAAMWSRFAALTCLLVPAVALLMVFRRSVTHYPSHLELVNAVIGTEHPTWLVVEQTLKVLDPDLSLTAQYKAESERRSFWWVAGMCAAMVVQPILAVILVMGAVR